jgi:hypothetical protein
MKKTSMMVIGFVALAAFVAIPATAATSGSIALSGSIPAIMELVITSEPVANNLPLTTTVADLSVATVTERSNKKAGYTVTLESQSAKASGASPSFVSSESGDSLPYSIKYGGNAVAFVGGSAVVSSTASRTTAAGVSKAVTVSFDGASYFLDESTYSDTLTFTIIAK